MTEFVDVVLGGTFHAAVLFLVAAGLQLVFGVQKIVNLACGSFYALGAYFGITAVGVAIHGRDGTSLVDPLGSSRSHGCIRVDDSNIRWMARVVPLGTPVLIT